MVAPWFIVLTHNKRVESLISRYSRPCVEFVRSLCVCVSFLLPSCNNRSILTLHLTLKRTGNSAINCVITNEAYSSDIVFFKLTSCSSNHKRAMNISDNV